MKQYLETSSGIDNILMENIHLMSCEVLRKVIYLEDLVEYESENNLLFGKISRVNESLKETNHDVECIQRLRIVSFLWRSLEGRVSFQIGFFESGEQLGCCLIEEHSKSNMASVLKSFNEEENFENLTKFHPTIEFLISVLDRMKEEHQILTIFQLETLLLLFQQMIIESLDDMIHIRTAIIKWIERNREERLEKLFTNMKNERWNNESMVNCFFSWAFSIIPNVTRNMLRFLFEYWNFHQHSKYFNVLLSSMFGNDQSKGIIHENSLYLQDDSGDNQLLNVLNSMQIKDLKEPSNCPLTYPQVLLCDYTDEYCTDIDPRSAIFLLPEEFAKCNYQYNDFRHFLFGEDFHISYLHYKSIQCENNATILEELKQFDISAYYYSLCMNNIGDLGRNAEMALKNGLPCAFPLFESMCIDKKMLQFMQNRFNHLKKQ